MPVCNFFLMSLGEGSQGTHKKFTGGCALQIMKLYFRHCTKKPSKITFIRGGVWGGGFVHWNMATVCRLAIFSSWFWGKGPKESAKDICRGLRGADGEVVYSSLYEKTVENHFYKGLFFFVHWRMATVSRFAIFPHGSGEGSQGTQKKFAGGVRSPNGEVVFSSLYEETIEDHCYKGRGVGWGVCALGHGHSMPLGNFFLMVNGGKVPGNAEIFYRGLRGADGEVVYSSLYEKTVENHFYKGGVVFFLCTGAWPQYAGLQFFPHGSWGGVSRNAQKIYRGLRGPDGEVVFSSLYEKRSKITFTRGGLGFGGGFVHWRMATVCRFAIFSHGSAGDGPKERTKI